MKSTVVKVRSVLPLGVILGNRMEQPRQSPQIFDVFLWRSLFDFSLCGFRGGCEAHLLVSLYFDIPGGGQKLARLQGRQQIIAQTITINQD